MQELGSFIYFLVLYFLVMVFLPAKVLRLSMGGKQMADSAVKALIASYTVCISWVYVLGLLHIYNRYTLIIGLLLTLIMYGLIRKEKFRKAVMDAIRVMALLGGGQYRAEIYIKGWGRKVRKSLKEGIKVFFKNLRLDKILFFLVGLAAFLVLLQRRLPAFLGTYAYGTSDMYVHTEWINYMEAGDIFYDGIYPFGMHNILSALHLISGLHINQIMRFYGITNCFLVLAMAVYFLRRVGRTKTSVLVYLVVYCITNFSLNVDFDGLDRMSFTLPQECGMPFMMVSVLFLGKFLENRKKEDSIYFALASALTLSMHFFTVIFAVILCGGLVLVYLPRIWKEKLALPLCRCLLLIMCVSIIPFLGGMLEGKQWQGSMQWALSVMSTDNSREETVEETEGLETEEAETTIEDTGLAGTQAGIAEKIKTKGSLLWNLIVDTTNAFWGYVLWGGMIYAAVYFLLGRKWWQDWRNKQFFAVWLTLFFCIVMLGYKILGIPQLMKEGRVWMFINYLGSMLLGLSFETLAGCFGKWGKEISEILGLGAAALCFYVTYGLGNIPFQTYFYLETSTAAEACVKIAKEYEKNTWTVVSPVEELYFVRGQGYHYELWEFIVNMERYEVGDYLEVPTKYVFFILEKNPLPNNMTRIFGQKYDDVPLDRADADTVVSKEMLGIPNRGEMKFYNIYENRRALEAKLAEWLSVYSEMFPEQMTVYMESDDCIIYRLEQNIYALNNLAVDYGYNVISDEEYDQMLIQKQKEWEEMSEE